MKDILALRQRPVLQDLAKSNSLLVFDYDGALARAGGSTTTTTATAAIATASSASKTAQAASADSGGLRPATRALLVAVASHYPVAVITGRRREQVLPELEGILVEQVVGCHGAEWDEHGLYQAQIARVVNLWLTPLERAVSRVAGAVLECFTYSIDLHYREARDKNLALRMLRDAVSELPACRIVDGEGTLSAVPALAPSTRGVVAAIARRCAAVRALFVGEAVEDEDAPAVRSEPEVIAVKVGREDGGAGRRADYYLAKPQRIDDLLRTLSSMRAVPANAR